jgi:putative AdoMet-dependent methyltransferase
MMNIPQSWRYDEFKQVGKDYSQPAEAEVYDSSHADFRDAVRESETALDLLGVKAGSVVIDFGAGTGTFAVQAAKRGAQVYAVDVSPAMIAQAQDKAAKAGITGIMFCHAGFLTYEHQGPPVDAISISFSFHHLPDFWKGIALKRLAAMLKPGGRLYLYDVILTEEKALENIAAFIAKQTEAGGDFLREDAEMHFRDEHSTYDWVMDGLLERAGFQIESKRVEAGLLGTYVGVKAGKNTK